MRNETLNLNEHCFDIEMLLLDCLFFFAFHGYFELYIVSYNYYPEHAKTFVTETQNPPRLWLQGQLHSIRQGLEQRYDDPVKHDIVGACASRRRVCHKEDHQP